MKTAPTNESTENETANVANADPTTGNVIETQTATAQAIHAALAIAPTTPEDALSYLHTVDPDAAELWRIRGPKGTKIVEISAFVLEIDGAVKRVLSSTYADGKFKLFVEAKLDGLG